MNTKHRRPTTESRSRVLKRNLKIALFVWRRGSCTAKEASSSLVLRYRSTYRDLNALVDGKWLRHIGRRFYFTPFSINMAEREADQ